MSGGQSVIFLKMEKALQILDSGSLAQVAFLPEYCSDLLLGVSDAVTLWGNLVIARENLAGVRCNELNAGRAFLIAFRGVLVLHAGAHAVIFGSHCDNRDHGQGKATVFEQIATRRIHDFSTPYGLPR